MAADRLDLLRLAVVAILCVDLSPGVADDPPCLARVNALWRRVYGGGHGLACAHLQQLQSSFRPWKRVQ